MKQAIEFLHQTADFLIVGPRKKQPHYSYILIHEGMALIRLGKLELPVCQNQGFWLPSGCLAAVTVLQGSLFSTFNFSIRSTVSLPNRAGYIAPSTLVEGIVEQLNMLNKNGNNAWVSAYGRLLRCARDYFALVSPDDKYDDSTLKLAETITWLDSGGSPDNIDCISILDLENREISEQLKVRNWIRKMKSGQNSTYLAQQVSLTEASLMQLIGKIAGPV
ncbi:hypothetical protein AL542_02090 [Grimontia hollisae]|nr:hypothetical protein [Grimontia hollisae]AMG29253.2 hypothetical protein AL542_02090 [Grimontia hollisae]STO76578.1 Uncharacterised protein [Grimontia hollisae]